MNSFSVTEGAKLYRLEDSQDNLSRWDKFVDNHPQGTVFHHSSWQKLIGASFAHQPFHIAFEKENGALGGILPLFLVRSRIFGRMLISTPQAAYGGVLADTPAINAALHEKAREFARKERVQFLELRNFQPAQVDNSLPTKDLYVTFRQELSDDPEKIFLKIPRKTRAECREGIRNGLEFGVDAIGIEEFYSIYSRNVRDLGTPVFSRKLFANGPRIFKENCRIFSVHHEGKPVAAVWTLFYKNEVIPYYGGSLREYNRLAVNNFMYWMLIKYGCENGYDTYDFGRSKKGTGSFDFKKRWGMVMSDLPYQYHLVEKQSLPDTSPLNPKFSLGVRLWRKLPMPIANTVGPIVANHLI